MTDPAAIVARLRSGILPSPEEIEALWAIVHEDRPVPLAVLAERRAMIFDFSKRHRPRRRWERTYWQSAEAAHDAIKAYIANIWPSTGLQAKCPHPPDSDEALLWNIGNHAPIDTLPRTVPGYFDLITRLAERINRPTE